MTFQYISTGDTTSTAVNKINENFSGTSDLWSAGTGLNSFVTKNDTNNTTNGDYGFAGGKDNQSNGLFSFSYGDKSISNGDYSVSFGSSGQSIGDYSFSSGYQTTASGNYSFTFGHQTAALGDFSFTSGYQTTAIGLHSHAEGYKTTAIDDYSFAGGYNSIASGYSSFIYSKNSLVTGNRSAVIGGENLTGTSDDTVYVPSLMIDDVSGSTNPTKILSIDSNGYIKTRDYVSSSSSIQWNTPTDTSQTLSLNNGYISKVTGTYSFSNFNLLTLPTVNDETKNGSVIKIVSGNDSITKIKINFGLSYYNDGYVNEVTTKYIWLLEHEYIEFTYSRVAPGLGGGLKDYWVVNKFITNLKEQSNTTSTYEDYFAQRITTS